MIAVEAHEVHSGVVDAVEHLRILADRAEIQGVRDSEADELGVEPNAFLQPLQMQAEVSQAAYLERAGEHHAAHVILSWHRGGHGTLLCCGPAAHRLRCGRGLARQSPAGSPLAGGLANQRSVSSWSS